MLTFLTLRQVRLRAGTDIEAASSAIGACLEVVPSYLPVGLPTVLRNGRTESLIAWVLPLVGSRQPLQGLSQRRPPCSLGEAGFREAVR